MRPVDVVVLSRYSDIFQGFRESIDRDAPQLQKFVIWDERVSEEEWRKAVDAIPGNRWYHDTSLEPFSMAKNANLGWHLSENDILYCGDDVRFPEPDTVKRLQEVAYSDYSIGIVSPRHYPGPRHEDIQFDHFVPFVCVYIKRSLIDHIGYLDERFGSNYGMEDLDYCIRARKAGAKIAWANRVTIQHGVDETKMMTTFRREFTEKQLQEQDEANMHILCDKWGFPHNRQEMWDAIKNL